MLYFLQCESAATQECCNDVISPNIEPSDLLSPPADSVKLVGGTHLCSGRLQVKWNQVWSSVCSDGFDLQDAEVVCRELGCGSPSGFEEELYGGAPEWSPEFRCGGHESALLHCERSDRDTCSPGTTVTLTCSGKAAAGITPRQQVTFPQRWRTLPTSVQDFIQKKFIRCSEKVLIKCTVMFL